MGTWYTTRETVKSALDSNDNGLSSDAQVDRAIEAASRSVDKLCHRVFYPRADTRYFDWPNVQHASPWRLWLDQDEIVSVDTLVAGAVTIPTGNFFLESANRGAPYRRVEINVGTSSAFAPGPQTWQRAISITGVFGWPESLAALTTLTANIGTTTATTCAVADSSTVGVGDHIKVDTEYLRVTNKTWTSTGVTLAADLTDKKNAQSVTLSAPVNAGETILLNAEQMFVFAVSGNVAQVVRGFGGTTNAAHTGSVAVYAPRTLTVTRGNHGSVAATHTSASAVSVAQYPGPVVALTVAYAIDQIEQERSAYARTVGSNENIRSATGSALQRLEDVVRSNYARKRFGRAV